MEKHVITDCIIMSVQTQRYSAAVQLKIIRPTNIIQKSGTRKKKKKKKDWIAQKSKRIQGHQRASKN